MTTHDRQSRLDTERQVIHQAMQHLLTGSPQRSDGQLTVSALAAEARLPRQRLYEYHAIVIAEFQTKAVGGPLPPSITALQQQLADARARIQEREAREAQLLAWNQTSAASSPNSPTKPTPTTSSRSTPDGAAGYDQSRPNNTNYEAC